MKKIMTIMIFLILMIPFTVKAIATNSSYNNIKVYFFYEEDCEECEKAKEWLEKEDTLVRVEYFNIDDEKEFSEKVKNALNIKKNHLFMVIGSTVFEGFNDKIKNNLKTAIQAYKEADSYCDVVLKIQNEEDFTECLKENQGIYQKPFEISTYGIVLLLLSTVLMVKVFFTLKEKEMQKNKINFKTLPKGKKKDHKKKA